MNLQVSHCKVEQYYTILLLGELFVNQDVYKIPIDESFNSEFGEPSLILTSIGLKNLPTRLKIKYLSVLEKAIYIYDGELELKYDNITNQYNLIIVNCAPYGNITLWLYSNKKSILLSRLQCKVKSSDLNTLSFKPFFIKRGVVKDNNIYSHDIKKQIRQYCYKYLIIFYSNDKNINKELEPTFDYIEEYLSDGTFDKLHDHSLLKYHEAGKPKKIAIKWHIKKLEYTACFWFENDKICSIFERFYGIHTGTKTDFIIRIDAEKKKYELALYRQGLKEPQIIPEEAYQLLVFKNKFEDYRSNNYNQERGAWIW